MRWTVMVLFLEAWSLRLLLSRREPCPPKSFFGPVCQLVWGNKPNMPIMFIMFSHFIYRCAILTGTDVTVEEAGHGFILLK
jgi:hypothetical protein